MGNPLVSVVIPCFNAAKFILEALHSVHRQTYQNLEIVVVDDGSRDDTAALVERENPDVLVIRASHRGISCARNLGVGRSQGELIAFMDADDILHPERIEQQVAAFRAQPDLGLCYTAFYNFPEVSSKIPHLRELGSQPLSKGCLCGTVMISRDCWSQVGAFDETYQSGEFIEWYLRAQKGDVVIQSLERVLYYRRTHEANSSRDRGKYSDYARLLKKNLQENRR